MDVHGIYIDKFSGQPQFLQNNEEFSEKKLFHKLKEICKQFIILKYKLFIIKYLKFNYCVNGFESF